MLPNIFNPAIHRRQSIRLKEYDYATEGAYFITLCCKDKICRFGEIVDSRMNLNECGKVIYNEWMNLPNRFPKVTIDSFQIMPNHLHGVIVLEDGGNAKISEIIGAFKSISFRKCLDIYKKENLKMGVLWQRNYFEHIIRNDDSWKLIDEYIFSNTERWAEDKFFV